MKTIQLNHGKTTLVSDQDYWLVSQFNWHAKFDGTNWYARTARSGRRSDSLNGAYMHRVIAGLPPFKIDHKNGKTLDNRRSNLRPADSSQNGANSKCRSDNTSGYKGVSFYRPSGRWRAQIAYRGKVRHVGVYDDPETAHRAYCVAAKKLFGEFARTQ